MELEKFKHLGIDKEIIEYLLNVDGFGNKDKVSYISDIRRDKNKINETILSIIFNAYEKLNENSKDFLLFLGIERIYLDYIKENNFMNYKKLKFGDVANYFDNDGEIRKKLEIERKLKEFKENYEGKENIKKVGLTIKGYKSFIDKCLYSLYRVDLSLKGDELKNNIFNVVFKSFKLTSKDKIDFLLRQDLDKILFLLDEGDKNFLIAREVIYDLVSKGLGNKEESFIFELFDGDFNKFDRYFGKSKDIYKNKDFLKKEIGLFKKNGKLNSLDDFVLLDSILDLRLDYESFLKKEFMSELTKEFGFTVHYKNFDIEKLMRIGIENIKIIIKERGIQDFYFFNIVEYLLGNIDDEEVERMKKYDLFQKKFGHKFTSTNKEIRDELCSEKFSLEKIKTIKEKEFLIIKEKLKEEIKQNQLDKKQGFIFEEVMYDEINEEELEELKELVGGKEKFSPLHKDIRYIIIKKIGLSESKKLLKRYKEDFGMGKAKFLKYYFFYGDYFINKLELKQYFGDEFNNLGIGIKNILGKKYTPDFLIRNVKKGELLNFYYLKEKNMNLKDNSELEFQKKYSQFFEEFGKNFSSFPKKYKEFFFEEGISKIKKFQKENSLSKENTLKGYLYGREYFNKGRIVCKDCGRIDEINSENIYKIQTKLYKCDCKKFRSRFERIIYEFIIGNYKGEVLINQKFLKVKGRKNEIDIYIPELKFGIEFNGKFYHNYQKIDERTKNKINEANKLGIEILVLDESDFDSRIKLNELIKEKILNMLNEKIKDYLQK